MRLRRKNSDFLEVDEIFLDSYNSPGYNRENFEGSLEEPIKKNVFLYVGLVFFIAGFVFLLRIFFLQVYEGDKYFARGEYNHLRTVSLSPARGIIYDREGNILAGNNFFGFTEEIKWVRRYPTYGFLHVLGFLSRSGEVKGVSGVEAHYDDILKGTPGTFIEEVDAKGNVIDSGISVKSSPGMNLKTNLSRDLQIKLSESIAAAAKAHGFSGGAGVFIDVRDGGILALSSSPEFDPNVLLSKPSQNTLSELISDPGKPFFNRAIAGLYPAGSIIKPAIASAALNEDIIDPSKQIFSSGVLIVPNPYDPSKPSRFLDWKAHGWVDMREALAMSSNVYFYTIGGGFEGQKGLGVSLINKYLALYGWGSPTGVDLPGEGKGNLPDTDPEKLGGRRWNVGDTYNLSIGQGFLQVTPLQMAAYVAAIASDGVLKVPHVGKEVLDENNKVVKNIEPEIVRTDIVPKEDLAVVKAGMRDAVLYGTAKGLSGLPVEVAAKTGTAEIGKTGRVDSWSIGFFPYEKPKVAFAVLMENGSEHNLVGATFVTSEVLRWMTATDWLTKL
ncbi:hypothetical protein HYT01_02185 [Candidatus Giovannonibacteria bacterium]|nr:hypothetical protein [Candidatus Giovannonibacteria bacterium]